MERTDIAVPLIVPETSKPVPKTQKNKGGRPRKWLNETESKKAYRAGK